MNDISLLFLIELNKKLSVIRVRVKNTNVLLILDKNRSYIVFSKIHSRILSTF